MSIKSPVAGQTAETGIDFHFKPGKTGVAEWSSAYFISNITVPLAGW